MAALTNNWITEDQGTGALRAFFDVFVESIAVGLRKPDPRIYQLVCRELDVEPAEAVFLDDIGSNLKAARALGMTTIKVDEPDAALAELERVVGTLAALSGSDGDGGAAAAHSLGPSGEHRSTRAMRGAPWAS